MTKDISGRIIISDMLKATPSMEGTHRYVYMEASNEERDFEGERILAKAMSDAADYYRRYGNIDIDHITQIGPRIGIDDYHFYEIGVPVDVAFRDGRTFVKGEIYSGTSRSAKLANEFWRSLTEQSPPARWYPSVGGRVTGREDLNKSVVTSVRWTNIGFSKTPVNSEVPTCTHIPYDIFKKSWGPAGLDLGKALEAGHGTDSAALTGGGALRQQSLHGAPANYWDFRERVSGAVVDGRVKNPTARLIMEFAKADLGLDGDEAGKWIERFFADLRKDLRRKR